MYFTEKQLKKCGYPVVENCYVVEDYTHNRSRLHQIVKGKFSNILDVIFTAQGGKLDNVLELRTSENTPQSVRMFIDNVLCADIQAFQSAPTDEAALEALVPRNVQTQREFAPYLDFVKQRISEYRSKVNVESPTTKTE
ncbi:MAG: hypothetical protein [Microviridae sp.]|nr:MAG: hypothetical protein [Microviridae sp.]